MMLVAIISMGFAWGLAVVIKKYWLKSSGVLSATGVGFLLGITGGTLQVLLVGVSVSNAHMPTDFVNDQVGYAFQTFLISWVVATMTLKKDKNGPVTPG